MRHNGFPSNRAEFTIIGLPQSRPPRRWPGFNIKRRWRFTPLSPFAAPVHRLHRVYPGGITEPKPIASGAAIFLLKIVCLRFPVLPKYVLFQSRSSQMGNIVMRTGSPQIAPMTVHLSAAFLVLMGLLGASATAQDSAKSQTKDQPNPAKSSAETPKKVEKKDLKISEKKDAPKGASVKLGLLVNDPRALQGYTLMCPFVSPNTYLLDIQGRVVRTWKTDSSPALSATLLENGHLLRPGSIGGRREDIRSRPGGRRPHSRVHVGGRVGLGLQVLQRQAASPPRPHAACPTATC